MTKIDIFSGFLGAGKTTLIKKLMEEAYQGERLVLIENEFGEIGIDGGFLKDAGVEITEMNSGCICCSLVGDFGKALQKVMDTYAPDRILIEPSGVGKLSDVISAVQGLKMDNVRLNGFTTVADANKCKLYMKNFGEFYNNQVEHASTVILSRTQGMSQTKLDACVVLLREKNPNATIVTTPWDQLSGAQLLEAIEQKDTLAEAMQRLEEEHQHEHHHDHDEDSCGCGHEHHHDHDEDSCGHEHHHDHDEDSCGCGHEQHHDHDEDSCGCGHEHHHDHGHHHADEVFTSWGVETSHTFTQAQLEQILEELDEATYGLVLRAKGIVPAPDGSWLHFDHVPGEAEVRHGAPGIIGRLCVIGSQLDEPALAKLFGIA